MRESEWEERIVWDNDSGSDWEWYSMSYSGKMEVKASCVNG